MNRRGIILCLVALCVAVGGFAWICLSSHGPAYHGKPLSVWMDEWNHYLLAKPNSPDWTRREQARAAIGHIGTDALPTLLRLAGAQDSALKTKFIKLANKQHFMRLRLHPAHYYHARATYGFSALGPAAKPAVPALTTLLRSKDPQVRASAAQCLSLIGPEAEEAVPALIQILNEEKPENALVVMNSMLALGNIHTEPETVIPVLLQYVNGSRASWNISVYAMGPLGQYREKAKSAVPAILPFLNDPDSSVRSSADSALCLIGYRPDSRK